MKVVGRMLDEYHDHQHHSIMMLKERPQYTFSLFPKP
ncbi:hypothetical protein SNOG_09956 [Parastagonospora nodorum SN15]|uniref:Uncharacterized protein n=1 Tax=Phaeosphaeria nodorum (strain SN15 / ATCC MYA-4574 / FGSC 10173) TaxID=321614 RepID=Q0UE58_PHANO|nr:hypothetical protein SNOG_09956 [Parastagonospora nodorum SN15]EAT82291.1 hypothetical protein SNOG_09956 [Parastagonospora nodorum SN15]